MRKSKLVEWIENLFSKVHLTEKDLHNYQKIAFEFMRDNPFSALFLDTGLGKTAACLYLLNYLHMNELTKMTLVIGPLRVANVTWPDEFSEWSFGAPISYAHIRNDEIVEAINAAGQEAARRAKMSGHGATAVKALRDEARQKAAQRLVREFKRDNPCAVHIVNQEQVEFLVEAWGKDWPYDTVIIDESSSLKDHTTNRWKALWKIRNLVHRMHQLTATPASETYLHLYAQITLLDKGERFGTSFNKFKMKYFDENKYSRKVTLRDGAEEAITRLIADICIVMKQEDYLDLAQPVPVFHPVHLSSEQIDLYNEMEDNFIVTLPGGEEVEAETASALSQKLLQMASGVLYDTIPEAQPDGSFKDRRIVYHLHDHKIDKLRQLQEEVNGENLLVAYYHQSSLERLKAAFPEAKVMDKAGKLIAEWNKGKIKMLLLHPQSGAHGLNLQKGGRHVVFFDLIWSYERYYQFYRRLARQGQKYVVVIHHLISVGTKDELVATCLKNKCDAQEVLFDWIRKLRRRYLKRKQAAALIDDEL